MNANNMHKRYSLIEMLRELNIITKYYYPNIPSHLSEITSKQQAIYDVFEIQYPE
jgi:hypothetical protein